MFSSYDSRSLTNEMQDTLREKRIGDAAPLRSSRSASFVHTEASVADPRFVKYEDCEVKLCYFVLYQGNRLQRACF